MNGRIIMKNSEKESKKNNGICYDCNLDEDL